MIRIVGGGLAGTEAAWQAARRGVPVALHEMRPVRPTAVHRTDRLAELVCSNSFRGDRLENAVGLLKAEMRQLGSLVMRVADATRVPAGGALAVDRERFAAGITEALEAEPLVTVHRGEVTGVPAVDDVRRPVIVATGPLTSEALADELTALVGHERLYFFDAISPIVHADSIDAGVVFRASRHGRQTAADAAAGRGADGAAGDAAVGDYLNCPLDAGQYARFHEALRRAEVAELHDFDRTPFFEGCLPIEVMAHRGVDTLRFGPMKPVGLTDPATGRRPYAVVQLRQDNLAADHFSLVGFQTQLKWREQARVLRMVPGLERAEFVRFGVIHRNTYINAPAVLRETWQMRARPALFVAGQLSGVEGYVESAASGLMAGIGAAADHRAGGAGALRVARPLRQLPADQHCVRAHSVGGAAAAGARGATRGPRAPCALRPGGLALDRGDRRWRAGSASFLTTCSSTATYHPTPCGRTRAISGSSSISRAGRTGGSRSRAISTTA